MEIGVIGAGNIGGNAARQFARAGHSVLLSLSRHPASLIALAQEIGAMARTGTPMQAAACEVVMISVPWGLIDTAMAEAGSLEGKVVIDTTNKFSAAGAVKLPDGQTAAQFNAARMRGSRYTKSFNTLTAGFQAAAALRPRAERAVQWIAGDDAEAKGIVMQLIDDAGFAPVDLGGLATCAVMEAPRRPGAVYGDEWRLPEALDVVEAVRTGRPVPATPQYQ
jgi:8-hydroxy-5-deazaflavin:NADPH oxidoreductase